MTLGCWLCFAYTGMMTYFFEIGLLLVSVWVFKAQSLMRPPSLAMSLMVYLEFILPSETSTGCKEVYLAPLWHIIIH